MSSLRVRKNASRSKRKPQPGLAIVPSDGNQDGRSLRRSSPRSRPSPSRTSMQNSDAEAIAKIAVNSLIALAALVALVKLLPYNLLQRHKIETMDSEVKVLEARVSNLRSEFSRYFDAHQAKSIMRERSDRLEAGQARVIWLEQTEMNPVAGPSAEESLGSDSLNAEQPVHTDSASPEGLGAGTLTPQPDVAPSDSDQLGPEQTTADPQAENFPASPQTAEPPNSLSGL